MANTKRRLAVFSVVAVLLVIALAVSFTAVMNVGESNYNNINDGIIDKTAVSVSDTAPTEDGSVDANYKVDSSATPVSSIDEIRTNRSGKYYLTGPITVNSFDIDNDISNEENKEAFTFTGTLDGCGNTITINATHSDHGNIAGGLFSYLNGTVKNVKIVVEKFSFGTASAKSRHIGVIAGQMDGGLVENVSIDFRYSPANISSEAYFYDTSPHENQDNWTCFGGVAGAVNNNDKTIIRNVTAINNTTGNYGISTYGANYKKTEWNNWFPSASTTQAVGMIVGLVKGNNTTDIENITLKRGVGTNEEGVEYAGKMTVAHSNDDCDRKNRSGMVIGLNQGALNLNGIIIDKSYFTMQDGNYTFDFAQLASIDNSENYFGVLLGRHDGSSYSIKNLFAVADMDYIISSDSSFKGVISIADTDFIAFDRGANSGNIILKSAYQTINEEFVNGSANLLAQIKVAGKASNVLSALTDNNKVGQTAYVSVAKSDTHAGAIEYVNAVKSNATIDYSLNESGQYNIGTKEYDGNVFVPVVNVGANQYSELWTSANNSANVGTYTFDLLNSDKVLSNHKYVVMNGIRAFLDLGEENNTVYILDAQSEQAVGEIIPRNLEIVWGNAQLTYAGIEQNPGATATGVDGKPLLLTFTGDQKNVGTGYVATASLFTQAENYNITNPTCEFSIVPMVLGGEIVFAGDNVYSGSDKEAVFNLTEGQLFEEDKVAISYGEGADRKNVGSFEVIVNVPSENYTFAEGAASVSGTLSIVAKEVNLQIVGSTREYNGMAEDFANYEVTGADAFVASDNVQITVSTVEENSVNVGRYTLKITTSADDNNNYIITRTEDAVFEITPHKVVIEQSGAELSKEYDGAEVNAADLFVVPQGYEGELALAFSTTKDGVAATIKDAGEYTVSVSLAEGQTNYTADSVEVVYTINKKNLVIGTESDAEKLQSVYNGEVVAQDTINALFTAPVDIEGVPFELNVSQAEIKNADTYTITADVVIPEDKATNYTYTQASIQYTVNPVVIDGAIVLPEDLTYDGNAKEAVFSISEGAMVGGDKVIIEYSNGEAVMSAISAGTYTVTAKLPAYADGKSNYKFADGVQTSVEMVIAQVEVEIVAKEAQSKVYDGKVFDDLASLFDIPTENGVVLKYDFAVTKNGETAAEIKDAGEYTVTATLSAGQDNYLSNSASATITVVPVRLEIEIGEYGNTATGITVVYGEEFSFVGAKIMGTDGANVQIGDTSYAYTLTNNGWTELPYTPGAAVGETFTFKVELSVTDLDASNYTYDNRITLTVIATPMGGTLVAENDGVMYDGNAYGAILEGAVGGVTEADYQIEYALEGTEDWTTDKPVNAGIYRVRVISLNLDYSADRIEEITFTIEKADVVVKVVIEEGTYYEGYGLPAISLGAESSEGTIVWTNPDQLLVAGTNEYHWTFTSADPNYKDAEGTISIEVLAVVFDHIEVEKTENFKTEYEYGDEFDKSTIVVKAVNNDGTFVVLNAEEYTVDALTTGATSVNVTYNESTATVTGFVVNKKSVELPVVNDDAFVYNGAEYTVEVAPNELYTLGGEMTGTNAGNYTMTATLNDTVNYKWANSEDATVQIVWSIAKATRTISVDMTVDYKTVSVTVDGDTAGVQYSLDGKTFVNWDGKAIAVDFAENYKIYFKYAESDNYLESAVVAVEKKVSKKALAGYVKDSFDDSFGFDDIAKYNEVLAMAEKAEGESEELDSALAQLKTKYDALLEGAKESAEEALSGGGKLAGSKVAKAVALTLTTAFAGIGLAAMSLRVRKGGKKND